MKNNIIPLLDKTFSDSWIRYFSNNDLVLNTVNMSGLTSDRPIDNLYIGMSYFDTTLGKPVWLKSVKPSVWVLATGTVA